MKSHTSRSLKGEYVFYKDGVEVLRSPNIITNNGKENFINYLSKSSNDYASKITLGIGSAIPVATNEFLGLEIFPLAVNFRTVDFTQTPSQVVFRTTIPGTFSGVIYEAGLTTFGGTVSDIDINSNEELLATFDENYEPWTTSANVVYHSNDLEGTPRLRAGNSGLQMTAAATTSVSSSLDSVIVGKSISSGDAFKVAFHVSGSVPTSIEIKLEEDSSNYLTVTIPAASISLGYNIFGVTYDNISQTGSVNSQGISKITVTVNAGSTQSVVTMDTMRFDNYTDLLKPVLVSHSLLPSPLVIEGGIQFDIEYRLGFSI
jgi:hypothetical protein